MGWIGPVADGQQHEGWVLPLFADGAQGAGTTSARGRLIARRPDDGPCDGDRGRLTYRDGTTVECFWSDRTLLRVDGIVHAPTSGQVRLEVIEQAEQWRPTPPSSAGSPAAPAAGAAPPGPGCPHRRQPTPRCGGSQSPARGPTWRPPTRTGCGRTGAGTSPDGKPSRRGSRPPPGRPPPPARWTRRGAPPPPPGAPGAAHPPGP